MSGKEVERDLEANHLPNAKADVEEPLPPSSKLNDDELDQLERDLQLKPKKKKKKKNPRDSRMLDALESGTDLDPDSDLVKSLKEDGTMSRKFSENTELTNALTKVTRGDRTRKRKKTRSRTGTAHSQASHYSVGSRISLASHYSDHDVQNLLSKPSEGQNQKAYNTLDRTLSRISLALSNVEDGEDDEAEDIRARESLIFNEKNQNIDKKKSKRKSRYEDDDPEFQYIEINPNEIGSYVNAANLINSDPTKASGIDLEFISPVAAEIQKKAAKGYEKKALRKAEKAKRKKKREAERKANQRSKKKKPETFTTLCIVLLIFFILVMAVVAVVLILFKFDIISTGVTEPPPTSAPTVEDLTDAPTDPSSLLLTTKN